MLTESAAVMFFSYLSSQETARDFLTGCYQKIGEAKPETKSYDNAQAFIHYISYGLNLYAEAQKIPKSIQPMLFFYGSAHLIKACLLAVRPYYPEQTAQLAHGVTARKRKKKDYQFLEDEVKIQQQGLFPYFSEHLFGITHFTETKLQMGELLTGIPDLLPMFEFCSENKIAFVGKANEKQIKLPSALLDGHQSTWKTILNRIAAYLPSHSTNTIDHDGMLLQFEQVIGNQQGPFMMTDIAGSLFVPLEKGPACTMSEMMIHYLILYNLSMLSRYETEWWGDLFAAKDDLGYPMIHAFLDITAKKFPWLIAACLQRLRTV